MRCRADTRSHLLWFRSRCEWVSGITWGSLSLPAGNTALFEQVSNDYKIRFGQFIVTTWTCTLVSPLPFILKLSALIYLIGVTDEEALTHRPSPFHQPPSLLLHGALPWPFRQASHRMSPAPYVQTYYFNAPLHIELRLTSGGDEQRLIISDRSDQAEACSPKGPRLGSLHKS